MLRFPLKRQRSIIKEPLLGSFAKHHFIFMIVSSCQSYWDKI
ncbi:hypothetical protein HS9_00105 [Bacillus velezensis]|nr:hypothetical protein HS9_00105 [Bacillus velezensis]